MNACDRLTEKESVNKSQTFNNQLCTGTKCDADNEIHKKSTKQENSLGAGKSGRVRVRVRAGDTARDPPGGGCLAPCTNNYAPARADLNTDVKS